VQANGAKQDLALANEKIESLSGRLDESASAVTRATSTATQAQSVASNTSQRLDQVVQQTAKAFEDVSAQFAAVRTDMGKLAQAPAPRASGGGAPTIPPGTLQPDGSYVIKAGDTFQKLARQFNIPVGEITKANPNVDAARLKVGQKIRIPGARPAPAGQPAPAPAPRST
jgi:LysM repeat protein